MAGTSDSTTIGTGTALGKAYDKAVNEYNAALTNADDKNNKDLIAAKKVAMDRAEENYTNYMTVLSQRHQLVMQLISMLGRN